MSKNGDERAFPVTMEVGNGGSITNLGMSLRDYFAAKAVQGLISGAMADGSTWDSGAETLLPEVAYKIADGMLAARSAQPQTLEVAMSDWIKIEDAMPEAPVDVQVYCSDTKEQFVAFHDKARKQFTYAMDHEGNRIGCMPTHWKLLGPAPTE